MNTIQITYNKDDIEGISVSIDGKDSINNIMRALMQTHFKIYNTAAEKASMEGITSTGLNDYMKAVDIQHIIKQ